MNNTFKKACAALIAPLFFTASSNGLTIVLDPGHGGKASETYTIETGDTRTPGAIREYGGKKILERNLNLKIVKFMEKELKNYVTEDGENVKTILTWDDTIDHNNSEEKEMPKPEATSKTHPNLEKRVKIGYDNNADAVISIHNNASEDRSKRGAMVLVTDLETHDLYKKEEELGLAILKNLNKIGISIPSDAKSENQVYDEYQKKNRYMVTKQNGLLRKLSEDGYKCTIKDEDGNIKYGPIADWYGIVKYGITYNIPSIIVENCYLSNKEDYENFLSTDEKLEKLAKANVCGIAEYFKLNLQSPKKED